MSGPGGRGWEFRVWCENGDLIEVCDTMPDAQAAMDKAIAGEAERYGEAPTGVLSEHGYSIQIIDPDGVDVTSDSSIRW